MSDINETLEKANKHVAWVKASELARLETQLALTVHAIPRCIEDGDTHGLKNQATLQNVIIEQLVDWKRW